MYFLSHILTKDTPLYGGEQNVGLKTDKSISKGDSCNVTEFNFTSHAGTHVDAPKHFIENGKSIDVFPPEAWVYNSPAVIDVSDINPGQLILPDHCRLEDVSKDSDFLIFRTNFEKYRGQDCYWEQNPGLSLILSKMIVSEFHSVRAVGMDFISVSSFQHRDEGRQVHKTLLEHEIFLYEDISLSALPEAITIRKIMAFPIRYDSGDGSPVTIIGFN